MPKRSRFPRRLLLVTGVLALLLVSAVVGVRYAYNQNLRPVSQNPQTVIVTVESGSSVQQIGTLLANNGLIRNDWVFKWYVHSHELSASLKAGTYALSPSQPLNEIVDTLTVGEVATELVTILPGRRIDQVRADLINDGFSVSDVDAALQPSAYRDLPILSYAPKDIASLEGLLFPESYQRTNDSKPEQIIRASLKDMGEQITPTLQQQFAAQGLSVYQGIILASMLEREVASKEDREQAAQVFLTRLEKGMTLGSDVTALYGAVLDGKTPSVAYASPYSTSRNKGLPPGPISTVSKVSLTAAANPSNTEWLYFVSGDDGTTYFSKTLEEHEAKTEQYCTTLCGN